MKVTWRHYYSFPKVGDKQALASLFSAEAWDEVRTAVRGDPFYMPMKREEWIQICQASPEARDAAEDLARFLDRTNQTAVFSAGVGRACVEYHLKALRPCIQLICAEFSSEMVYRLKTVFSECDEVIRFDLLRDAWPRLESGGLVLLNRVDTELDDAQWEELFTRLRDAGIDNILLIATGFLGPKEVLLELWRRLRSRFGHQPLTHAGYIRTKSRLMELWGPSYCIEEESRFGGLTGFWLRRRRTAEIPAGGS